MTIGIIRIWAPNWQVIPRRKEAQSQTRIAPFLSLPDGNFTGPGRRFQALAQRPPLMIHTDRHKLHHRFSWLVARLSFACRAFDRSGSRQSLR